jgi:FlaA1/EpsC-like NDP-sugar epimerase
MFKDKIILITGGTGFLGRTLTEAILKQSPQSIRLLSRDEVKHYRTQELFKYHPKIRNFIGDVRDYGRLIKATRNVDIVIHAAALKRLDLIEYNVEESIKTNIIGTLNIVNACLENHVKKAVFVSTDKACSPVNTYGACKFVSERIFSESHHSRGDVKIIFTTVRFGNVLESTGSVIPLFRSKIKNGDPIPLTDPQMTRFIITPQQAIDLIFNAIEYSRGGEVFVPHLPSFKILDLIEILKKKKQGNNKVKIIGIRPGEKIHELMINQTEMPRTFKLKNFYIIYSSIGKPRRGRLPAWLKQATKVKTMTEYSSKDHVISKTKLEKLFQQLKLI